MEDGGYSPLTDEMGTTSTPVAWFWSIFCRQVAMTVKGGKA